MPRSDTLYPPGPKRVPPELTAASDAYQTQMILALLSLFAFVGFYFLLVAGMLTLGVVSLVFIMFPLSLLPAIPCFIFFLFLIKGFFRKHEPEKMFRIEIAPEDHPRLFDFLERLCQEVGAPIPYRVFITPEVNAAVFYDESVFGLIVPPPKNLLIGMGLINVLTLSEFKAVMAHEFGHFSQKGMLVRRYLYTASKTIVDMIYGEDWLDRSLNRLCDEHQSGGFAVIGWMIYGVLWCCRKPLEGCFWVFNLLNSSLSRQMEFNADLVAVSVTGSDAIVNGLARLDFATESLDQAFEDLRIAADHEVFTDDLFFHHNHAMAYLRRQRKKPHLGEPPPLPADPECSPEVFDPEDHSIPAMWSTHPTNYDREQNAKRWYLRCDLDGRSPWLLFDDPQELRQRLTRRFYRNVVGLPGDVILDDAEEVQKFINEEHAETTYDPRYHGAYDNRPIKPGNLDEVLHKIANEPWKKDVLIRVVQRFYGDELKARMKELNILREEFGKLLALDRGVEKPEDDGTFRFRGKRYDIEEVERLVKRVGRELDEDTAWLHELDERVFRCHYQMAREMNPRTAEELHYRYQFQLLVQTVDMDVSSQRPPIEWALEYLSTRNQLAYEEFHEIRTIFREAHDALMRAITHADKWRLPKLQHVAEGAKLGEFLLDGQVIKGLKPGAQRLKAEWIGRFLGQLGAVQDRIRRIHFKSLGGILALQEQIRKQWWKDHAQIEALPEVE